MTSPDPHGTGSTLKNNHRLFNYLTSKSLYNSKLNQTMNSYTPCTQRSSIQSFPWLCKVMIRSGVCEEVCRPSLVSVFVSYCHHLLRGHFFTRYRGCFRHSGWCYFLLCSFLFIRVQQVRPERTKITAQSVSWCEV